MTVTSTNRTDEYVGDDIVTVFPYTWLVFDAAHVKVFFDLVEQLTGFTVDGVGNPSGGNVTFDVAPADLVAILINRIVPLTQLTDYTAFDPFPSESHEQALDLLTMANQQIQDQLDEI